ncbi:MAG: VWA domain-containing protein [Anaerolineales bacterium]|nr:VWA domain-containing protein [Anaerolineales bacterium]
MPGDTSFYDRLGISRDASQEQIRLAFREAARRLHPDVNTEAGATELFLHIKEAYEILIDPDERAVYDGKLAKHRKSPLPVRFQVRFSQNSLTRIQEKQLAYALLDLDVLEQFAEQKEVSYPPLNIALVLDCSTSMQGERLDRVKAAAIELLKQLRPQDTLAIVGFNDRADVILPANVRLDPVVAESRIRMLQTFGGTEIYQGLSAGLKEIQRYLNSTNTNHIVLVTDGHTYGDEQKCLDLANRAASDGIIISGLGIGSEWNDEFLDELTRRSGGTSMYVSKSADIKRWLDHLFKNLGKSFAERVSFNFRSIPAVELLYAYRIQPDAGPLPISAPIQFGEVPYQGRLSVLLEFLVDPISTPIERIILAEGDVTFHIPGYTDSMFRIPVTLMLGVEDRPSPAEPPTDLIEALSNLTLYRMQERARHSAQIGNIEAASRSLQHLATHLLARGENELAKTVIIETQQIQQQKRFSQNGEKQIKYGTRALSRSRLE